MDIIEVTGKQYNCMNKFKKMVRDFDSAVFSPLFIK